jgi:hypothetical protein
MHSQALSNPKQRIAALARALIPMLKEMEATDGRMIEFSFVVSMSGDQMVLHKGSYRSIAKIITATKQ